VTYDKTWLNIGCGLHPHEKMINHDRTKHHDFVDVAHDLNILPWPFDDNSFDFIQALAVFEHLDIDLVASLNECHRILKPGGRIRLKLPLQDGHNAYDDPTHRWFFTLKSLDQFCPETLRGREYSFYTPHKWKFIKGPKKNKSRSSLYVTMEALA